MMIMWRLICLVLDFRQRRTLPCVRPWKRSRIQCSRAFAGRMADCLRIRKTGLWTVAPNAHARMGKWCVVSSRAHQSLVPIHPSSMGSAVQFAFVSPSHHSCTILLSITTKTFLVLICAYFGVQQWTVRMAGLHGQSGLSVLSPVAAERNKEADHVTTPATHALAPPSRLGGAA